MIFNTTVRRDRHPNRLQTIMELILVKSPRQREIKEIKLNWR
jgi:hypothetical protein